MAMRAVRLIPPTVMGTKNSLRVQSSMARAATTGMSSRSMSGTPGRVATKSMSPNSPASPARWGGLGEVFQEFCRIPHNRGGGFGNGADDQDVALGEVALSQGDGWVEFLSRHGGGAPWCGVGGKIGNGQDFVDYFRQAATGRDSEVYAGRGVEKLDAHGEPKGVGGVDGSHGEIWENWVETWLKVRNSQSTTSETFVLSFGGNAECIPMQCAYPQAITGCSFPL